MDKKYNIRDGIVDIYGSGNFESLLNKNVTTFRIARNQQTAVNDPVVVDLSQVLSTCPPGVSVDVQRGTKVIIGGRLPSGEKENRIEINGGMVELKEGLGSTENGGLEIVVGPQGGTLIVDSQEDASTALKAVVRFLDEDQNYTDEMPDGFLIDYPQAEFIRAWYIPSKNITVMGSDAQQDDKTKRTLTFKGDPFQLQLIGNAMGYKRIVVEGSAGNAAGSVTVSKEGISTTARAGSVSVGIKNRSRVGSASRWNRYANLRKSGQSNMAVSGRRRLWNLPLNITSAWPVVRQVGNLISFGNMPPSSVRVRGNVGQNVQGGVYITPVVKYYSHDFKKSDGQGGVITCYLSGSEVKVPGGRVCVEALQKGAEVLVHDSRNGLERRARVVWVGKGRVHVRPHLPDDEAGWPVKILRHALGENIPYKDMCVTSEHCFFLGGVFVPVRMLVNGASIFYDKTQSYYDYWHFETECHEIIDVDGAFTETFLNTGHDHYFGASEAAPGEESAPPKSWATDAAAPLETRREVIEPLYRRLSDRSQALGLCIPHDVNEEITFDPGLALCDEQGHPFPLKEQQGHRYLFSLDGDVDSVVLLSRTSRPCDVIGPYIDDRRELGVLVGEVRLLRADGSAEGVTGFLSAPQAEGWDVQEHGPWRWMNGEARLDLPTGSGVGACLSVEVKAGGPYPRDDKNLWARKSQGGVRIARSENNIMYGMYNKI